MRNSIWMLYSRDELSARAYAAFFAAAARLLPPHSPHSPHK